MPVAPSPEPAAAPSPHPAGPSPHPGAAEPLRRRRDLRTGILLGLAALLVYNANLRSISAADAYPARYLPFALWRHGTVLVDPIVRLTAQGRAKPYWIVAGRGGHLLSLYPVTLPVLAAPLYLPAALYLQMRGWDEWRLDRVARVMEKATASLLAAAAVALMYLLLRRRAAPRDALLLTAAFAFGTTTWVISSQALWQHGLAELLLTGALLLVTGPASPRRALALGLLCGLMAANRPPDAILAAAIGLHAWRWSGGRTRLLIAGAALPVGLTLLYNVAVAGNLAGGYGIPPRDGFFHRDLLSGVAGLLVSPARGLLLFSPFLLFLPMGLRGTLRAAPADRNLTLLAGGAAVLQLLFYARADWRAGACWGPRWLTDLLPLLLWMLAPAAAALRAAGRLLLVLAIGAAVAIEAVGAFWYTGQSDLAILAGPGGPDSMAGAWDLHNLPFVAELRHPPAAADLLLILQGAMDRVGAGGHEETGAIARGTTLTVGGWALAGGRAPAAVMVLVDDLPRSETERFFRRPDVAARLHQASPSGWRVVIGTGDLAPGSHRLTAAARLEGSGEYRPLAQRQITIAAARTGGAASSGGPPATGAAPAPAPAAPPASPAPLTPPTATGAGDLPGTTGSGKPAGPADPANPAGMAAELLRDHQQPAGYWLTAYTGAPRFAAARPEMNVFLTSMIVDLLAPVAETAGLGESVQRARRHLAGELEDSGLARYHGRPDGPTIPALGCAISPDADDTALLWRLTAGLPADGRGRQERSRLLASALATLRLYRTDEGLYRTWLTPRASYRCIDPGRDPNPADGGIQMHVFLFLAQADPPAARALCGALRRRIADEGLWVYYQEAPLVPLLRQADLRLAGCALDLPASRLRTPLPGQQPWLDAARLLERWRLAAAARRGGAAPGPSKQLADETGDLLRRLASGSFAAVRDTPPLLYHNDLTAATRRFYWSQDFGYALWLRLYFAAAANGSSGAPAGR